MKNRNLSLIFIIACINRLIISLIFIDLKSAIIYTLVASLTYLYLIKRESNCIRYLPFIVIDFMINFYFISNIYSFTINSLMVSTFTFLIANYLLYYTLICYVSKITNNKSLIKKSNDQVDKGIKALESDDYNLAKEAFTRAIKEHKKNYLGYIGMYNTLTKENTRDLKKLDYYKKQCLKYAPKEIKDSLTNRFK